MKANTLFGASPLLNRSSFTALQEDKNTKPPMVFSILFNMFKTKARSEMAEKIFQHNQQLGRSAHYYHLQSCINEQGEIRYQLQANHDQHYMIPSGKYPYVILSQADNYELRIGLMHHYYLAEKRFEVVAAGEIIFEQGVIAKINDRSGGYHLDAEDELVQKLKKVSLYNVFDKVGLPRDKFYAESDCKAKTPSLARRCSV